MKREIEGRKIESLFHFTHFKNLDSILANGIIPRRTMDFLGLQYAYNDKYRLDGYMNASCISISHPNYKMFYSLRMNTPDNRWVVLELSPNILLDKKCLFCHANAASAAEVILDIESKTGINGFRRMFTDTVKREQLDLSDKYPTNPQAEVLVLDKIEPKYIKAIHFDNLNLYNYINLEYPKEIRSFEIYNILKYFSPRSDHKHW